MNANRQKLIAISNQVKFAMKSGALPPTSINQAILSTYPAGEYHTFHDWHKQGLKVIKGEHGYLIWGRKRKMTAKKVADDGTETEKSFQTFPICFLFHESQVS